MWDEEPTDQALLAARLNRGWRPVPTATVDGDQVLGYAAGCSLPAGLTD